MYQDQEEYFLLESAVFNKEDYYLFVKSSFFQTIKSLLACCY